MINSIKETYIARSDAKVKTINKEKQSMFKKFILLFLFVGLITTSIASAKDYFDIVGQMESNGNYATNTGNGAYGKYQFRKQTLTDLGYMKNGQWTGKNGLTSMDSFLSCSTCQDKAALEYGKSSWNTLNSNQTVNNYLGKTTSSGVVLNESALLECAHYFGPTGCKTYLDGCNTTSCQAALAKNPHIENNMAKASEGDSSAITGGTNLVVDNSALAAGGKMSSSVALGQIASYCAKEVQALLNTAGEQAINNQVTLAGNSETGYTLMNGQGLLDDALKNGGGIGNLGGNDDNNVSSLLGGTLSNAGYRTASCLDNMMNSITSIGGVFSNIDLNSVLSQLQNQACSKMQNQFSSIVQPIQSEISNLNGNLQVGGGGFLPGMQIGSVGLSNSGSGNTFRSLLENNSDWYKNNANSLGNDLNFKVSPNSGANLFGNLYSGNH